MVDVSVVEADSWHGLAFALDGEALEPDPTGRALDAKEPVFAPLHVHRSSGQEGLTRRRLLGAVFAPVQLYSEAGYHVRVDSFVKTNPAPSICE